MTAPHEANTEHEPIPVKIISAAAETRLAPEFGNWRSTQTIAGAQAGVRILPQESKRNRAIIVIAQGAAANRTGSVFIGKREVVLNGQGAQLDYGMSVVQEAAAEVWMVGDGINSLTVSVLDERYR
jgi:hypothetical protein